ncbi:hypothetical protein [Alcaligenes faecalis]|uniref:hypothetical protein n=1 Tax=Alcaligenes faecalis TaxID=511 RepID=UPI001F0DCF04|nr:hypothetical protein [Alcaligenes faecalis]
MIPIVEAARTIGMQPELLANELLNDGAHVFTHNPAGGGQSSMTRPGRDFDGEFIWNETEATG